MAYERIARFSDCVSEEEKSRRFSVTFVNVILWLFLLIFIVSSAGTILIFFGIGWLFRWLFSEYNTRRIQALGATAGPTQMPEVYAAAQQVCQRFGIAETPRIIVLPSGEMNAFAVKFAQKKVVVILSELLTGVIDQPAQLRYLLAHELCHHSLDHGARGVFELYKSARYRQGRELTCDNAGIAAADDLGQVKSVLKILCVGRHLSPRVNEQALIDESKVIYSGFAGWLLRNYLTHPPAGTRLSNAAQFHESNGGSPAGPIATAYAVT